MLISKWYSTLAWYSRLQQYKHILQPLSVGLCWQKQRTLFLTYSQLWSQRYYSFSKSFCTGLGVIPERLSLETVASVFGNVFVSTEFPVWNFFMFKNAHGGFCFLLWTVVEKSILEIWKYIIHKKLLCYLWQNSISFLLLNGELIERQLQHLNYKISASVNS